MTTSHSDWFDSLLASLPEWSDRWVQIAVGSHASADNLLLIEGRLEHADRVPANERTSADREAMLFIRADETVALTLIEDTVEEGGSISATGFQATIAGVTAEFSVLPEQAGSEGDGWSHNQRAQALRVIGRVPWGDVENSVYDLELCLRRAIQATEALTEVWDELLSARAFPDEFSLSSDQVAALTPPELIAYVGQLVRTASAAAGLSGDRSSDGGSLAAVLQDLVLTDRNQCVE